MNVGLQEIEFIADIMPFPRKVAAKHRAALHHRAHGVGELNLVVLARLRLRQVVKDVGLEAKTGIFT